MNKLLNLKNLTFMLVIIMLNAQDGDSACCLARHGIKGCGRQPGNIRLCGDCTKGTPYCGYGKCNIFGCNCDGGCRHHKNTLLSKDDVQSDQDTFVLYDLNKDGLISWDEYVQVLKKFGKTEYNEQKLKLLFRKIGNQYDNVAFEEFKKAKPHLI